jgi:hypothetical protein
MISAASEGRDAEHSLRVREAVLCDHSDRGHREQNLWLSVR